MSWEVPEWQRDLSRAIEAGVRPTMQPARRSGTRHAMLVACALAELEGRSWDVVGPNAPTIRREAREVAARISAMMEDER